MLEPHERAIKLIGVPFRAQGRDEAVGLDCVGVVISAYQLADVDLPTYRMTDGCWVRVEREIAKWFEPAGQVHPEDSDLAILRLPRSFHFGVISGGHLVHADMALGRVVKRRLPSRSGHNIRFYRLRGVS